MALGTDPDTRRAASETERVDPPSASAPSSSARREAVVVVCLFGLALAMRWPNYLYEPTFNDEAVDVLRAVEIARGQLQTLVDSSSYIGSLHNYLMAATFVLFGPRIELPRLLMVVVGALTVIPAYLLAREWGGRAAGALAGALLATNAVHVLVNSHIAWSNGMTPLFTTFGLWALTRAAGGRRKAAADGLGSGAVSAASKPLPPAACRTAALPLAGLSFGLAMHTHPAAAVVLPGCAVYLLWRGRGLLRSRGLFVACGLFLAGSLPVVLHNLTTGFETFRSAQWKLSERPSGPALGVLAYFDNLWDYGLQMMRTLASSIEQRSPDAAYLLDPMVPLWLGLAAVSLIWLARRGQPLPLLVVLSSLLASACFNAISFEPVNTGRYAMPAVIVVEAAVAALIVGVGRQAAGGRGRAASEGRQWPARIAAACRLPPTACLAGFVAAVIVVAPLGALAGYDDTHPVDNRALVAAEATIEAALEPGEVLLLDRELSNRRGPEGVKLGGVLEMLLTIRSVPYRYQLLEPDDVRGVLARRPSQLVVLDGASVARLRGRFDMEKLAILNQRPTHNDQPEHAVYRLSARP